MEIFHDLFKSVVIDVSPRSFFILATISIILYRIPILDKVLRTFHTLLHESGHAFASFLTSGKIRRIELHPNMSGITATESNNKFKQFLVSISGYPFASAFAYFSFFLIFNNKLIILHLILLCVIVWQVIFNIRNFYGIIWALTVATLMVFELIKMSELLWASGVIISSIVLFESLFMSGTIMVLSFQNSQNAGDASNLYKITKIHSAFWGIFFFLQAVFFVYLTIKDFLVWQGM